MKAFSIKATAQVYVYVKPTNMCCSFLGLSELAEKMSRDAADGSLFLFMNKKRNYIKILFWSNGGWCIFAKKLPRGMFSSDLLNQLTLAEMQRLVDMVVEEHGERKGRKLKAAA